MRARRPAARLRAHPRSRGENPVSAATNAFAAGSSPLTRGKRIERREVVVRLGLIPAHAGKTTIANELLSAAGAHPRSRGENPSRRFSRLSPAGSSPLTRGKPYQALRTQSNKGLIPAHAGKTSRAGRKADTRRAHPRSRGENPLFEGIGSGLAGSSPLTRGKLSVWVTVSR